MPDTSPNPSPLTACEHEPIRFPGAVQPHGALLVVSAPAWRIEAASESCEDLLGQTAVGLIGEDLPAVLGATASRHLLSERGVGDADAIALSAFGRPLVATARVNEAGQVLVAIEPGLPDAPAHRRRARHLIHTWRGLGDAAAILDAAVHGLREMSGFDRVMVYRFDEDWNGEVLAEARSESLEPFLGLHYPASDIPRQARELYRLIRLRAIADVDYRPSALVARAGSDPIDLGTCGLRSVSPMHIEYCRNMGVRATLVVSLLVDGRLWGLVACHHHAGPRHCSPAEREELACLCEDLGQLLSLTFLRQRVVRMQPPGEGVVVAPADITTQKLAWLVLQEAEKRYRDLEQDQTDSVMRFGADGRLRFANEAACRYFERSREAMSGLHWQQLTGPDDVDLHDARVRSATPELPVTSVEMRIVTPGGRVRWGHFVNRAVFDAQGRMVEAQSVGRDISDRKATELQVQRLIRTQEAILNSPVIGILKALDGHASWANAALADILGCTPDELIGQPLRRFFGDEVAFRGFETASAKALRAGQVFRGELPLRRRDGRPIWVEVSAASLDPGTREMVASMVNISHLKAAEAGLQEDRLLLEGLVFSRTRALAQARDEAQAASRAKSVFLMSMSHELRTPMNAFMGMTHLALKRATDPKQAEQLNKALQAAQGLLAIINDILDLSRIEAGKIELERRPFELASVFDTLKALTRERAARSGLEFALQLDPELQGQGLIGDGQRLGQVLFNLVANAIKFTRKGAVRVLALRLEAQPTRIKVRFEVQDTGIGIAAEDQARLFRPFEQVDGSTTRLYGGSGLGLWISRRLVELMCGEIGLQSEPGRGSTFWCTLWLDRHGR